MEYLGSAPHPWKITGSHDKEEVAHLWKSFRDIGSSEDEIGGGWVAVFREFGTCLFFIVGGSPLKRNGSLVTLWQKWLGGATQPPCLAWHTPQPVA